MWRFVLVAALLALVVADNPTQKTEQKDKSKPKAKAKLAAKAKPTKARGQQKPVQHKKHHASLIEMIDDPTIDGFVLPHIAYDGTDDNCNGGGAYGNALLQAWEDEIDKYMDELNLDTLPGSDTSEWVDENVYYHGRCHKCGGVMMMEGAHAYVKAEEDKGTKWGWQACSSDISHFKENEIGKPSFYICTHRSPESFIKEVDVSNVRFKSISWQIRDPRDILVSGYNYHKETSEGWASWPQWAFGGQSYQEKINSFDTQEEGLLFEMEGRTKVTFRELFQWMVLEEKLPWAKVQHFSYEGMWNEPQTTFTDIAQFHNLPDADQFVESASSIVASSHDAKITVHMHGGSTGAWKTYFTDRVKSRFKALYGDLVVRLGYEENNDW